MKPADKTPQERPKQQVSAVPVKRNIKPDVDSQIPHGKLTGRTLGYVMKHEEWYYNYMQDNDLIYKWGLYIQETIDKPKRYQFMSSNGEIWLGLREVPGNGIQSEYIE